MRIALIAALVLGLFVACQPGEEAPQEEPTPLVYDIGVISREISTDSADAQLWFDRGLGLAYGFNHEEAIVCFEKAIEADPNCAICY